MDFYLDDLTIKLTGINIADILSSWTWLIKDWDEVLLISKLGDLFFKAKDGGVYWLATDSCELTKVGDSKQEFYSFLNDDEKIDNWFLPQLLKQLVQAGIQLNYNQVYSYKKMPVLGGEYSVDNIEPLDLKIHFELTGIIGEQIKDLPNGTKIKIKITD
ncbi:MAG: hypothetical protein JWQ57_3064 [Mucilaginibacter sp.]|nr:hypothetical protein [Mucilaginibacter sp.]